MELRYHSIETDVLVIDADGGLNRETAAELVDQVRQLVEAGLRKILVDCSQLDYISSLGMSALLRLHASMKKRGASVKICGMHGVAAQALQLMRLDRVFDIQGCRLGSLRDMLPKGFEVQHHEGEFPGRQSSSGARTASPTAA